MGSGVVFACRERCNGRSYDQTTPDHSRPHSGESPLRGVQFEWNRHTFTVAYDGELDRVAGEKFAAHVLSELGRSHIDPFIVDGHDDVAVAEPSGLGTVFQSSGAESSLVLRQAECFSFVWVQVVAAQWQ